MGPNANAHNGGSRPKISALYLYPVKSCRGIALQEAQLDEYGIAHDREWMLVSPDGRFLTQREHPGMALITPELRPDALVLTAPGMPPLPLPLQGPLQKEAQARRRRVCIWRDEVGALDEGEGAAAWVSALLGVRCRLVRRPPGPEFARRVPAPYAVSPGGDRVGFADGFPLLLLSQASLEDLNARLSEPVEMERFRPNVVVSGCGPYEEDTWRAIAVGGITLHAVKPCARCTIPTVDPGTGERDPRGEPLRTLARYRRGPDGKVYLGQNLVHVPKRGTLRVGETVEILEIREEGLG